MDNSNLFKYAEKKANLFNIYCLLIISILGIIAEIFNEIGVFTCDKNVMRYGTIQLVIYGTIPLFIYLIHDKILKREKSILEFSFLKWLIIIITFVSILDLCISFSFHTVLVFSIPPLMAAQYNNSRKIIN